MTRPIGGAVLVRTLRVRADLLALPPNPNSGMPTPLPREEPIVGCSWFASLLFRGSVQGVAENSFTRSGEISHTAQA